MTSYNQPTWFGHPTTIRTSNDTLPGKEDENKPLLSSVPTTTFEGSTNTSRNESSTYYYQAIAGFSSTPSTASSYHGSSSSFPSSTGPLPLSWFEARHRLRLILQQFLDSSSSTTCSMKAKDWSSSTPILRDSLRKLHWSMDTLLLELWELYFDQNGDVITTVLSSLFFLVLFFLSSVHTKVENHIDPSKTKTKSSSSSSFIYTSLLSLSFSFSLSTATFFIMVLFTLWITWKRKYSKYHMEEPHIRHVVSHYLKKINHGEEYSYPLYHSPSSSFPAENTDYNHNTVPLDIPATHLNDIYNVFRLSSPPIPTTTNLSSSASSKNVSPTSQPHTYGGKWLRVPSLLLVTGDYIALQAGDTVPGNCFPLSATAEYISSGNHPSTSSLLTYGSKLPPISHGSHPINHNHNVPPPTPYTTNTRSNPCWDPYFASKEMLMADSTKLIHLCNNMRIFIMDETPMDRFLKNHSPVQRKIPQIHRQALALRRILYIASVLSFVWTLTIHGIFSLPFHNSLLLLSSIGTLSTGMFICNFLIEIMGTSRILMGIHLLVRPHPSNHGDSKSSNNTNSNRNLQNIHREGGGSTDSMIQQLFRRYLKQVMQSRLGMHLRKQEDLIHVPPASAYLFEKLGVVTTVALVDDELVCCPVSTPHQLLLPTDRGLKLLNLCSKVDEHDNTLSMDHVGEDEDIFSLSASSDSGDSDAEESPRPRVNTVQRSRKFTRKVSISTVSSEEKKIDLVRNQLDELEVQFEDPEYWHYLPSLKCIGLCCLLVDGERDCRVPLSLSETRQKPSHEDRINDSLISSSLAFNTSGLDTMRKDRDMLPKLAEEMLVRYIRRSPSRFQLLSLARSIGFRTEPTSNGSRGDITPFIERGRFHVIATRLLSRRMTTDLHAIGLEESRHWGYLRSDTESVVVKDLRTNKFQLLTTGDARTVTDLCSDSWQGEHCTLIPLSQSDRQTILEMSKSWALADLDVCAFSYSPVPFYIDAQGDLLDDTHKRWTYLVDNRVNADTPISIAKDSHDKWFVMKNQIFLGLLGSTVSPRREAVTFLDLCNRAGVRFRYFSPRNMRRTKELASQMGIDVAWNCAISLRPLHEGEEADRHRMISSYADWDVNARLPHGVDQVKRHLIDVDNVPLLVHLFTDVTRQTTAELLGVFKEYHETVLVLGLSHVHGNVDTFSTADLAIGINNIASFKLSDSQNYPLSQLTHDDISFVCAAVSHSCVFKLSGDHFLTCMPKILSRGRAALDAGISSVLFSFTSYISFAICTIFCSVTTSTSVPCLPPFGAILLLYVLIPMLTVSLCFTSPDKESMNRVPPKNESSVTFAYGERLRLFVFSIGKASLPAIAPHILYVWSFAEIMSKTEATFLIDNCGVDVLGASPLILTRCNALKFYSGPAKALAECIMLLEFALCITVYSGSFLYRTATLTSVNPWRINYVWSLTMILSTGLIIILGAFTFKFMSWSMIAFVMIIPILSLAVCEAIKKKEMWHLKRSDTFRRLQFETKLGMWSPKA